MKENFEKEYEHLKNPVSGDDPDLENQIQSNKIEISDMKEQEKQIKPEKEHAKLEKKLNKPSVEESNTLYFYFFVILTVFMIVLFLFFYIHYGRYRIEVLVNEKEIIKPLVDDRKYRLIKLTNNLEVLMISDPTSSRCSASMSVGVGSFQEDEDIPGLAHFTEHMIFLGSKSYPRPGEFEDHLSNYFGITNAFTEDEKTTFYFEIGCRGFKKALMMFSRMFAEPLFDVNFMNKEINAVNNENEKNYNQDNWKENQLIKHLANPHHPYYRFTTGNNKTLHSVDELTLNKRLTAFYNKYYIPNNMKLVLLSNQNLEASQSNVAQFFSDIRLDSLSKDPKINYGEIRTTEKAFTQAQLGKAVWYQKSTPSPSVDIIFVIDQVRTYAELKPMDYMKYLLRYSGEGSLIKYLKDRKYINKIDCGLISSHKTFSIFAISILLTEQGLSRLFPILDITFAYINQIRNLPVSKEIYSEIHNITKIQFKFLEKNEKYGDYLAMLSGHMFEYNSMYREILYGEYLHKTFNETVIKNYSQMISPENSIILIGSEKYPPDNYLLHSIFKSSTNETEKWYNTKYMEGKFSDEVINILKRENLTSSQIKYNFTIRPKNELITKENHIVSCLDDSVIFAKNSNGQGCVEEMSGSVPKLHVNLPNLKIWYKLDRSYLVPKVNIYFNIITPLLRTNPKDYLTLKIFNTHLTDQIESTFFDLTDTGGEIVTSFDENGFVITIVSFSDLVKKIIDKLLHIIFNTEIDDSLFDQLYQYTIDKIKAMNEGQPYEKSREYFIKLVKNNTAMSVDIIKSEESEKLTYERFNQTLEQIHKTIAFSTLFYGNIREEDIESMSLKFQAYLNQSLIPKSFSMFDLIDSLHAHNTIENLVVFQTKNGLPTENNHVVNNYFQIGLRDYKMSLTMNIIQIIWGNMFYYYLRTINQLGYVVAANKEFIDNDMYFTFLVQGMKKDPSEMNLEIDKIIWRLRDKILSLPESKLKEVLTSIQTEIKKRDTNLKERSFKVWLEIYKNSRDFNRKEKLLEEIDQNRKKDVIEAFDTIFIDKPKKLSIQIYAGGNANMKTESEEVYYLNVTLKYHITSDVNILNSFQKEDGLK